MSRASSQLTGRAVGRRPDASSRPSCWSAAPSWLMSSRRAAGAEAERVGRRRSRRRGRRRRRRVVGREAEGQVAAHRPAPPGRAGAGWGSCESFMPTTVTTRGRPVTAAEGTALRLRRTGARVPGVAQGGSRRRGHRRRGRDRHGPAQAAGRARRPSARSSRSTSAAAPPRASPGASATCATRCSPSGSRAPTPWCTSPSTGRCDAAPPSAPRSTCAAPRPS